MDGADQKAKSDHHPFLIRFYQYSTFPSFHYSRIKTNPNSLKITYFIQPVVKIPKRAL